MSSIFGLWEGTCSQQLSHRFHICWTLDAWSRISGGRFGRSWFMIFCIIWKLGKLGPNGGPRVSISCCSIKHHGMAVIGLCTTIVIPTAHTSLSFVCLTLLSSRKSSGAIHCTLPAISFVLVWFPEAVMIASREIPKSANNGLRSDEINILPCTEWWGANQMSDYDQHTHFRSEWTTRMLCRYRKPDTMPRTYMYKVS